MISRALRSVLQPIDDSNHPSLPVLSVYRELGVVPKAERTDNFNKTPEDVSRYLRARPGDLVVNKMKAWSGSVGIAPIEGIVSGDYLVCRLTPDVLPRFLHHLMRSSMMVGEMRLRSKGIRPNQERLYWDDLAAISVALPDLDQQRQIADFLDDQVARIDNIVAAREKQVELEDDALSATLRELLLVGTTVPARRLLREAVVGIVVQPSKYYVDADEPGVPALRGLNVSEREISTENLVRISHEGHSMHPRSRLRTGDVVVVRTGDAGAASQVPSWADDWNAIDLVILRVDEVTDSRYLMHALNANRRDQVIAASSSGSIQQHFGVGAVGDLPIVYRDPAEQAFIAAAADSAYVRSDERKSLLRNSIRLFQELKRSLITAAVTGEFDVNASNGSRVPV